MLYLIWLSSLDGLGPISARNLLFEHGSAKAVFDHLLDLKGPSLINLEKAKSIYDSCMKKNISLLPYTEYAIPDSRELPILLYYKGVLKKHTYSVGVVGSRRCSSYGKRATSQICNELASNGVTIVSGMAKGIDGYAHSAALLANGYTIAVLGSGLDFCYPPEHRSLMRSIEEKGLLLSQFPPGTHPDSSTFPQRNLVIAAFSDKLLVVEAGQKSGALITADYARTLNKPVFALPGEFDSKESEGTHDLIARKRASIYRPGCLYDEIRQLELPWDRISTSALPPVLSGPADSTAVRIVSILKRSENRMSLGELASALKVSRSKLLEMVLPLELNDIVITEGDKIWLR